MGYDDFAELGGGLFARIRLLGNRSDIDWEAIDAWASANAGAWSPRCDVV